MKELFVSALQLSVEILFNPEWSSVERVQINILDEFSRFESQKLSHFGLSLGIIKWPNRNFILFSQLCKDFKRLN